jgi:hypothetical protein
MAMSVSPAQAQVFLPEPVSEPALAIQLEKPFIPDLEGLAFYSSVIEADVLFPVGAGYTLQIGVPLGIAGADELDGTSLYLGNPRISLLFGSPAELHGFVGFTLPASSNVSGPDLALLLLALPWLNEIEKWDEDTFSARGAWIPTRALDGGGQVGMRVGGAAVAPTDFENLHVYTRIAGWARIPVGRVEVRADLDTSYNVTSDDGFGQQFTSYLTLGAGLTQSSGRPLVFLRLPLDGDAREVLDLSVGMAVLF